MFHFTCINQVHNVNTTNRMHFNFYRCTVHLYDVKIFLITNAPPINHIKCYNLHYNILYSLLHVSVRLDHPQGAYIEPG